MRLVFVHGMRQEGRDPVALQKAWEDALRATWLREAVLAPSYDLVMPFYGDVLYKLTEDVRGTASAVVARGEGGPNQISPLEEDMLREMGARAGITDADVQEELGQEVIAHGPANWEWVQALARVLEGRVPAFRGVALGFVRQVDSYLTRPHIETAVDDIVRPALKGAPSVVVAHSLGSIVAYKLLRALGQDAKIPLFVTLGSPLGIGAVKDRLKPPKLMVPEGVEKWLNGTDERDYVALYSKLDGTTFTQGIENIADIHNRKEDAHAIVDYLSYPVVARRIAVALAESTPA